jgi:hypothetical protein
MSKKGFRLLMSLPLASGDINNHTGSENIDRKRSKEMNKEHN